MSRVKPNSMNGQYSFTCFNYIPENKFLEKLESNKPKIKKCYNCMETCNPSSTPYCISQALINAVNGDIDNALLFCGAEAYKINKIKTEKKVIDELISEI